MLALLAQRITEVTLLKRRSQAGDPAAVALKGTTVDELLSHDGADENCQVGWQCKLLL